jgi:hypothetical protein
MDMFEPQDHPDDFAFPGAAPTAPYDTAGWTLAYQMGVRFDRILEGFDGPFELVPEVRSMPAGRIEGGGDVSGYFLSHQTNDAFVAINRLLEAGDRVFWLREAAGNHPEGTIYIRRGSGTPGRLNALARSHGLVFEGTRSEPAVDALELRPVRIGLWDEYGGSESSGWTRFVLESFGFGFDRVYAPRLDAGNLRASFDVLVFPNGAITERASRRRAPAGEAGETYRDQIGSVTREATVPRLREFLERGGAVLSVGGSTVLAGHLDLPVENGLTESGRGDNRPLDAEEFFVPGSILRAEVDTGHPLAYGLEPEVDVFFDQSPAFHLTDRSRSEGYRAVAWYPDEPLRSGWAWGEEFLEGAAAIVDAPVGDGRLILYGPEVTFRAQSHGTFRFLFNGIYYPSAVPVTLGAN